MANNTSTNQKEGLKIGLACAGGAAEGAIYEIGALSALEEAVDGLDFTKLHVYVGVSAGAFISSCLVNGVSPIMLSKALISRASPLLNLDLGVLFTPATDEYAKRAKKIPEALLNGIKKYIKNPEDRSMLSIVAGLGGVVPPGIFDNTPIHEYLEGVFSKEGRSNDFKTLNGKLRIVAFELDSSEVACFGDDGRTDVPISKAVQASTALPGLYCPVEIDGKQYIDGVARRTVHASVALEEGADLLICINPIVPVNNKFANRSADKSLVEMGLFAVLSQTFRSLVYSRMQVGFKRYEHRFPEADTILIEPRLDDHRMFFSNLFSFTNRQDVCEYAYQSTRSWMRDNEEMLAEIFAKHGLKLRSDILADKSLRLYPELADTQFSAVEESMDKLDRLIAGRLAKD